MKNYFLILFYLTNVLISRAQDSISIGDKYLSVADMHDDLQFLRKKLTKYHPDPYKYISKDSLKLFEQQLKSQIDTGLTQTQFRFYVRQFVQKIGCGHTAESSPNKKNIKVSRPILPIDIIISRNKLFVSKTQLNDSIIQKGNEVISINGIQSDSILKTIRSISFSDGRNTTFKEKTIQRKQFKYFFSFAFGYKSEYNLKIKNTNNQEQELSVKGIDSKTDTFVYGRTRYYNAIHAQAKCVLYKDSVNPNIYVMDINKFQGKKWRKFMRRSFRTLRKEKAEHLVIDLRENGGGSIMKGIYFLRHLVKKPFAIGIDRKINLLPINPELKMSFWQRLTPVMFLAMPTTLPRHWKLRHYFIGIPKLHNRYKGKVYVIINGGSFSMSAVACSYLKYKGNAVFIGEETGGNMVGSNAMNNARLILPKSKIQITIPLYHLYYNTKQKNTGHGIMPDYPVFYGTNDLLNNTDLEIKTVRELVK
ncbi:MAG: hypothetical protein IPM51_17345 [Sphingobacteriaceae bacterium]|nr:hypothetical protein [Sphingobacteriaceae bacterium]